MIEQIQQALEQIPLLPNNITRLLSIVNNPGADSVDLVSIVEEDPALSMQTLHLCNSAYYSLPVEITSVSHAVRFLGMDTVAGLAMAAYFQGKMRRTTTSHGNPWLRGIKKHLLATGQLSELISKETGHKVSAATAFTTGFLHDIGKLVFSLIEGDLAAMVHNLVDNSGLKLNEAEQEVLGMDHAEAGGHLAERWNMPEVILDVIRCHHTPFSSDYELTLYVYISDTVVHTSGRGEEIGELFDSHEVCHVIQEVGLSKERAVVLWEKWMEFQNEILSEKR